MPLEQFEYKHPKKISLGLFTRAFLFLFLTGLISLLIWLGAVLYGQHGHKALVISNRVMSAYNLSANALNYVKPELQHIFIDKFNTLGDIEISERFDSDVIKPIPHTRLWRIIEADLREKIDDKNLIISPEVNGVKGLWVSMDIPFEGEDHKFWIFISTILFRNVVISNWFAWIITALIISVLGSYLHTKVFLQPLEKILEIFKAIKTNKTPPRLDTSKGSPEVIDLYTTINNTLDHLRDINSNRDIMLKGLSHDIRTPLTRIRLEVEMSGIDEEAKNNIDTDLKQIDRIMHQISEYSNALPTENNDALNISEAIELFYHAEEVIINAVGGKFYYSIEPNLYSKISEVNLNRILGNLIDNAIKYAKQPNRTLVITLNCYRKLSDIIIEVKDNGPGLNTDELWRLMKPFERGDPARSGVKGSGLGLPIVDKLTKSVNGNFEVLKNLPVGLLCRVTLKSKGRPR